MCSTNENSNVDSHHFVVIVTDPLQETNNGMSQAICDQSSMVLGKAAYHFQHNCPLCTLKFRTKRELLNHGKKIHSKLLTFAQNGEVRASEKMLSKCTQCEFFALRKGRLARHLEEKHGIKEQIYCELCGKEFPSHRSLQHHSSQFHTFNDIPCDICGKKCKNRSSLQRHVLMHKRSFTCEDCGKTFRDRRCYTQHCKIHQARTSFDCPHCKQTFTQKFNMQNHVRIQHLKEGEYICGFCSFSSYYKDVLSEHISRVHHGIKKVKFECSYCAKTFSRRTVYDEHVDRHEGRYRYSCRLCGKKYRNKARCKSHFSLCEYDTQTVVKSSHEPVYSEFSEAIMEDSVAHFTSVLN